MLNRVFKELERYTLKDIKDILDIDGDKFGRILSELIKNKIVRHSKDEEDNKKKYWFNYVGIIVIENTLISVVPKYLSSKPVGIKLTEYLKLLTDVFRIYSKDSISEYDIKFLGSVSDSSSFSMISAIDFFINDYLEYGKYFTDYVDYQINGNGEINWLDTIDRNSVLVSNGQPIYYETVTIKTDIDETTYITKLHEYILSKCSEISIMSGLNALLDFPLVHFDVDYEALGDKEYIVSQIERELMIEYSDRKIRLLHAMKNFILKNGSLEQSSYSMFFGTSSFQMVWQKMCEFVYHHDKNLLDYVEKPIWISNGVIDDTKDTLEPDILSIVQSDQKYFMILDPKYYQVEFRDSKIYGNPGIGDIVKQYMYEFAIEKHKEELGVYKLLNALLFPTENEEMEFWGEVSLDYWSDKRTIKAIKLSAKNIMNRYKKRSKLNLFEWNEFISNFTSNENETE